jgi:hypothetical protein
MIFSAFEFLKGNMSYYFLEFAEASFSFSALLGMSLGSIDLARRFSRTFRSLFSFFVFNLLFRLVGFIQPSWSYFTFWLHHFVFFQLDNDYYLETFQELVCDRFDSRKKADECASKAIVFPFPILKSIACDVLTKF